MVSRNAKGSLGVDAKLLIKWHKRMVNLYQNTGRNTEHYKLQTRLDHVANLDLQIMPLRIGSEQTITMYNVCNSPNILVIVTRWFPHYDVGMQINLSTTHKHLRKMLSLIDSIFRAYQNGAVVMLPNFNPALETWSINVDDFGLAALADDVHMGALLAIKQGSYDV